MLSVVSCPWSVDDGRLTLAIIRFAHDREGQGMKATYASSMNGRMSQGLGSKLTLMVAVALLLAGISVVGSSLFGPKELPAQSTVTDNPSSIVASGVGTYTGYA